MNENFEKPKFLSPEINFKLIGGGSFTKVARLENLPREISSKIQDGFVIKEYKESGHKKLFKDPRLLFYNDEYIDNMIDNMGLEQKALLLKQREDFVRNFFADVLPNLVLKSSFLIGGKSKSDAKIYAIQPTVGKYITYVQFENDETRNKFLTPESQKQALTELKLFLQRAKDMPEKSDGFMIDLFAGDNILVLDNGSLRLIDTNYLMHKNEAGFMGETMQETYEVSLRGVERIIDHLSSQIK